MHISLCKMSVNRQTYKQIPVLFGLLISEEAEVWHQNSTITERYSDPTSPAILRLFQLREQAQIYRSPSPQHSYLGVWLIPNINFSCDLAGKSSRNKYWCKAEGTAKRSTQISWFASSRTPIYIIMAPLLYYFLPTSIHLIKCFLQVVITTPQGDSIQKLREMAKKTKNEKYIIIPIPEMATPSRSPALGSRILSPALGSPLGPSPLPPSHTSTPIPGIGFCVNTGPLSVEELQILVATICNPSTDQGTRQAAERRLQELQNEEGSWRAHIQLLGAVEDTLLFFLCLGLQRIVWKQWSSMNVGDHEIISQALVTLLATKSASMPLFARSKAELVLAAVCINSYSFSPVLQLVESVDPQIVFAGISALRTILEEVYQIDSRIAPASREVLIKAANEIIGPATQLACNVCQSSLQGNLGCSPSLLAAIALLKVIIGKAEIAAHITPDVLNLLFVIAQLGANSGTNYVEASVRAVGVLTDLMGRRYIPRGIVPSPAVFVNNTPSPLSPGSVHRVGPTAGPNGSRSPLPFSPTPAKDVGADVLVDLVVKAINLLQTYRCAVVTIIRVITSDFNRNLQISWRRGRISCSAPVTGVYNYFRRMPVGKMHP
jgi:hypothetical protein